MEIKDSVTQANSSPDANDIQEVVIYEKKSNNTFYNCGKKVCKILYKLFKKYILRQNEDEIKLGELNYKLQKIRREIYKCKKEQLQIQEERLKQKVLDQEEDQNREDKFNKQIDKLDQDKQVLDELRINLMENILKYENKLKSLTHEIGNVINDINNIENDKAQLEVEFLELEKVDQAIDNIKKDQHKKIDAEYNRIEFELESKETVLLNEIEILRSKI